jgi:hypothetical protein
MKRVGGRQVEALLPGLIRVHYPGITPGTAQESNMHLHTYVNNMHTRIALFCVQPGFLRAARGPVLIVEEIHSCKQIQQL